MKKIFSISFAALSAMLVGLTACNKTPQPVVVPEPEVPGGMLFVNLTPDNGGTTKADAASLTAMQSEVRSIQVFVFSAETNASLGLVADQIETSKFISGNSISNATGGTATSNPIALTTYLGKKKVFALVNAPRQDNVTTISQLMGRVSHLSENYITDATVDGISRQGMVMAGAYGYNYTATSEGKGIEISPTVLDVVNKYDSKDDTSIYAVDIPVYRLGARIEVGSVTVNFNETDLRGKTLTIKDIKLKNVVNAVTFGGGNSAQLSTPNYWSMRLATTGANAGTYVDYSGASVSDKLQDTGLSIACTEGTPVAVNKSFIVYPNPCDDPAGLSAPGSSAATTWSVRRTRLVIHAQIDGTEDTYYAFAIADPANLAGGQSDNNGSFKYLVGNRRYVIDNINISMKGKPNDDDDMLPATGRISATVKVQDWAGQTLLTYQF